jgi:hypothetical protein
MRTLSLALSVTLATLASVQCASVPSAEQHGRRDYPPSGVASDAAMRRAVQPRDDKAYGQTLNLRREDTPFYAGESARQACDDLAQAKLSDTGLTLNGTFSQVSEASVAS